MGWEFLVVALAVVFLLFQLWRGWNLGVVRAGIGLAALIGAGVVGWFAGMLIGSVATAILPVSREFVWFSTGLIIALVLYVLCLVIAKVLFKKTGHHGSSVVRLLYGFGGAFCGLLAGLVLLWAVVSGIRAFGGLEEGRQAGVVSERDRMVETEVTPTGLAALKQTLESGRMGDFVRRADPIPDGLYSTITRVAEVTTNEEAMLRLAEYPDIQRLMEHPAILELTMDPSFMEAAESGNFFSVMFHPALLRTASNPEVAGAFRDVDLEKALDYALQKPSTDPETP